MKKIASLMVLMGLSAAAGMAMAADVSSGAFIEATAAGCPLLRDRVNVNLSPGVKMVYDCTAPAGGPILVAGCHEAGSQKPTDIKCAAVGTNADGTPKYNDSSCNAAAVTAGTTFTISGRRVFTGSSQGGSVTGASLKSVTCDSSALNAILAAQK